MKDAPNEEAFSLVPVPLFGPFPELVLKNSAIGLPSWTRSVKLDVWHRVVFGLCAFVWSFFAALPRIIDFPQDVCSRASFLLLNVFYGGH